MNKEAPLERLEIDVLARIRRHREGRSALRPLQVAFAVCAIALIGGWFTGHAQSQRKPAASGSEAVLADDVSLAPSSLLASNQ